MLFKNVIGQADAKLHLVNMVQQNRISHALLFLGKEGSGALPLAIAFAQYIVCEKVNLKGTAAPAGPSLFGDEPPAATPGAGMLDACGECPSCLKMSQLMHPDVHFSYPVIPRKSGDKPLSSDYITEWREFIAKYPYGNSYDWLQF